MTASPGVGKTHLAVALGREAIVRGYSTLFVPATSLVTQLARAHAEGRLEEKLIHFTKPKLLVVDELGYLPFEANAAHYNREIVSYEIAERPLPVMIKDMLTKAFNRLDSGQRPILHLDQGWQYRMPAYRQRLHAQLVVPSQSGAPGTSYQTAC